MDKLPLVAIVGRANVGKSSLFNRFLEKRLAIVAHEPGTTRDSISGIVHTGKQDFWIVDTAGLKSAEDEFENSIQNQIEQAAATADLIIVVVDGQTIITAEDRRVAKMALKSRKPVLLAINKSEGNIHNPEEYTKVGIPRRFFVSAAHNQGIQELIDAVAEHLPKKHSHVGQLRRLAFVGRPNVGKSSLFNALLSKQQAVVANTSGTTRDSNTRQLAWHGLTIELTDTAGIRRPGAVGRGIEYFSVLRAIESIETADACALVMDANEPGTKLDQKIAGMIAEAGKGLILIVNKWDEIETEQNTFQRLQRNLQTELPFVAWAPLIVTSAVTGHNTAKLLTSFDEILTNRARTLSTTDLNRWLQKALIHHPPAGLKNKHPRLLYVSQTGTNPPTFQFHGRLTNFLHWSYKRYLEREIRQLADFSGTPLKLEFVDTKADTIQRKGTKK